MKIYLNKIDREQFNIKQSVIAGENAYLVTPKGHATIWSQENKIFRSSIWNEQGELISAGFPKFTNWGEAPDQFPVPSSLDGCTVVDKIDGSCLIASRYKKQLILRTRGTFDATQLENGEELDLFKANVLPRLEKIVSDSAAMFKHVGCQLFIDNLGYQSFLFEWVSPSNTIVVKHEQPRWVLIGRIYHSDYVLEKQGDLDHIAKAYGMERPESFSFDSRDDLLSQVPDYLDVEGVCVYSNLDQNIHKIKTKWYLTRHRFKENATYKNIVELYVQNNRPDHIAFCDLIKGLYDFECLEYVKDHIQSLYKRKEEIDLIVNDCKLFISNNLHLNRKDFAGKVFEVYGKTKNAGYVFTLLDKGDLDNKQYKDMLLDVK